MLDGAELWMNWQCIWLLRKASLLWVFSFLFQIFYQLLKNMIIFVFIFLKAFFMEINISQKVIWYFVLPSTSNITAVHFAGQNSLPYISSHFLLAFFNAFSANSASMVSSIPLSMMVNRRLWQLITLVNIPSNNLL